MAIYEMTVKVTAKGFKDQLFKGISTAQKFSTAKLQVINFFEENLEHPSKARNIKVIKHSLMKADFIINEKAKS